MVGKLSERVVLVTGSGRGIGRAIALAYAREGAAVALTSRTRSELDAVATEVANLGGQAFVETADLLDREAIKRMVNRVIEHFGRLDVLVNNAGGRIGTNEQLDPLNHDDESFEKNVFLNCTSAFYVTKTVLPQMIKQDYGRIIFIGSGYATHGGGRLAYTAAKHALVGLTRAWAYQVPTTITVNTLSPGWVRTSALTERAIPLIQADSIQKRALDPEEIGPMAVLLGSEESKAITGQVIGVDGGFRV
jgi:NAD(P)-dependent dehydrogenase (short-subunit alcohol dehydrogenase family)